MQKNYPLGGIGSGVRFAFLCLVLFGLQVASGDDSVAGTVSLPETDSFQQPVVSEVVPFPVFWPHSFKADDFALEWVGPPVEGVTAQLLSGSLEWARGNSVIHMPRGTVEFTVKNVESAVVENSAFHHPSAAIQERNTTIRVLAPLTSGKRNPFRVRIKRDGKIVEGSMHLVFRPRAHPNSAGEGTYAGFDPSCSPYQVQVKGIPAKGALPNWMYVGCRYLYARKGIGALTNFEMYVLWDGAEDVVEVNGAPVKVSPSGILNLKVGNEPGVLRLKTADREIELSYRVPRDAHAGFFSMGIGPYAYRYTAPGQTSVNSWAPLATIYSGIFLNETMRVVTFQAFPLHSAFSLDVGIYGVLEQSRFLDERMSLNILLGGHAIGFSSQNKFLVRASAPQGAEVQFRDFILRRYNLGLGSFLYPLINGRSYVNLWLRWGGGGFFVEYNYISWREPTWSGLDSANSVSSGISVGFPLFRFL